MKILDINNLTKFYETNAEKVIALDGISFSVEKGEFLAIIGQSGSGKSTLLHLIAGLDKPDSGKVMLNNIDLFSLKGDKMAEFRRREIGLIYQFYNLVPVLNVEENIVLPVRLDKKKINKDKLNNLLNLLNLTDRRFHLPNQLSGGQQQRTAIGRALFFEPSIILADEPTGNLDSENGNEIIKHLKMLNEKFKQTIIIVTHDNRIAQQANRIITLLDGKIVTNKEVI